MTTRRTKKTRLEMQEEAADERKQARSRLRSHRVLQTEELLALLGECRCPDCGGLHFSTMTDITHALAYEPAWQHDADGCGADLRCKR